MNRRRKRAIKIQESIRRILFEDWDPIRINNNAQLADEYDSYIGGIYRLLFSGATEHQIIERLHQLETVSMGLKGERGRLKAVAEKLLKIEVTL